MVAEVLAVVVAEVVAAVVLEEVVRTVVVGVVGCDVLTDVETVDVADVESVLLILQQVFSNNETAIPFDTTISGSPSPSVSTTKPKLLPGRSVCSANTPADV